MTVPDLSYLRAMARGILPSEMPHNQPPTRCWPCLCGAHLDPPAPHPDTTGEFVGGQPVESGTDCACDCAKETR